MLIIGPATTDLLRVVTDAAGDIRSNVDFVECDAGAPPAIVTVTGAVKAAITTATTTTILAGVATNKRNVKNLSLYNAHATQTVGCRVEHFDNTNAAILADVSLLSSEWLVFTQGGVWIHYDADGCLKPAAAKLNAMLCVTSDVTNATTSFADITGLTVNLQSAKKYAFEAKLFHSTDATTTGAQFGVNIGAAPTVLCLTAVQEITTSVTAAAYASSAMVTARDTAAVVETTGPGAVNMIAVLHGYIQPSADGTFAMRCKSEVAVAGGLVVRAGSWLNIRECDN